MVVSALAAATVVCSGCSSTNRVHPGLRAPEGQDLDRAIARGKSLIVSGADPQDAFARRVVPINERVSAEVILRSAGLCLPADRIAYEIAKSGDSSDGGVRGATAAAIKAIGRELMCYAEVQVPNAMDPTTTITFALRTSTGAEYPPMAVEKPFLLREFNPGEFDPTAAPAGVYAYLVHFPVVGGPGVPPIGPTASSVTLAVSDGTGEGSYTFELPRVQEEQ